jgi:nucleotide-binding universal stress UspA family protein
VIAHGWSPAPYRLPDPYLGNLSLGAREMAERVLAQSHARVNARQPELPVITELLADDPVRGLLELSGQAELLVVGTRGHSAFTTALLGSVSQSVTAHATVPVIVVRGTAPDDTPSGGTVVVGIAPDEAYGPVEFAFTQAQRHGAEVLAVRTSLYPQTIPGSITVPPDEAQEVTARETAEVEELLATARKAFPDVPVRVETGLGPAEAALVEASKGADLVVVGSRRHRRRFALPIGTVTTRVLHHAHCPVAVIPV